MITLKIITTMEFENEQKFFSYCESKEMEAITGFADECRTAYYTQAPFEFDTPRTEFGVVTKSVIEVK